MSTLDRADEVIESYQNSLNRRLNIITMKMETVSTVQYIQSSVPDAEKKQSK